MIIPTVSARIAQGTITCSRENAPLMALEMVGSPPLNRLPSPRNHRGIEEHGDDGDS